MGAERMAAAGVGAGWRLGPKPRLAAPFSPVRSARKPSQRGKLRALGRIARGAHRSTLTSPICEPSAAWRRWARGATEEPPAVLPVLFEIPLPRWSLPLMPTFVVLAVLALGVAVLGYRSGARDLALLGA